MKTIFFPHCLPGEASRFRAGVVVLLAFGVLAGSLRVAAGDELTALPAAEEDDALFARAAENAGPANEAFVRSRRLMLDWLEHADPRTGLLPRNLYADVDVWNPWDSAADNYPFLVITSAFTDRELFHGRMQDILLTETALTSRIDRLPDQYSFSKGGFVDDEPDLERIMFGAAEYVKDGLITIVELLGATSWRSRMMGILDDMWNHAPIVTPAGPIVSTNYEVNGEMLQVLSRVYWMTGDERYLDYALRLGDHYLLGANHPTRDFERLRLRDHGGEIVAGLTELYATVHRARPEKARAYREPLYEMLDRILEVGRNEDGLFYNVIDPRSGAVLDDGLADTWGYLLNGYYTVYQVDGVEVYREAVITALGIIEAYQDYDWERGSADGDADAIEGALYLFNREPVSAASDWMDRQIRIMWSKQDTADLRRDPEGRWTGSGVVEGWHGDGNFARTSIMYALWKTQGTSIRPWREDVHYGAVEDDGELFVTLSTREGWSGRLVFDRPRHRDHLGLPFDWPRINQFCEWFTVEAGRRYLVRDVATGVESTYAGEVLLDGIPVGLDPGSETRLVVQPL